MSRSMRLLPHLCLLLVILAGGANALGDHRTIKARYQALTDWIDKRGGVVKANLDMNHKGMHGIFATEFIRAGEIIATIPKSTIIDVGTIESTSFERTGQVLKEIMADPSPYAPFLNIWPERTELVHGCNLGEDMVHMLQSEFWETLVRNWQLYMASNIDGSAGPQALNILHALVGNKDVYLDDVLYACALTFTKVFHDGKSMLLIPIFDFANHRRNCTTYVTTDYTTGNKHFVAGEDLGPGDEICFGFKSHLRDDYAFINFGVLGEEENPPRLFLVDHHLFDFHDEGASVKNQVFNGTEDEVKAELTRLHKLDMWLTEQGMSQPNKSKGTIYNQLCELQRRRREGVKYEIKRLTHLHRHWLNVAELLAELLRKEEGPVKHPEL